MGLTVHWALKFKGTEQEALEKLEQLKDRIKDLPIEEIDGPVELNYKKWKEGRYRSREDWRDWACIQLGFWNWEIKKAFCLHVWPGEGCESMNMGLAKVKRGRIWRSECFCKTQYAKNFLKCHLAVIAVLDECKGRVLENQKFR